MMDDVSALSWQIGAQTAASVSHQQEALLSQCRELEACGAFSRSAFIAGISKHAEQLQPLQLVQLVHRCAQGGMPTLQVLQELLPLPQQAAVVLQKASCSQEVCLELLHNSCEGLYNRQEQYQAPAAPSGPLASVLQLLQDVLRCTLDAAAAEDDVDGRITAFNVSSTAGFCSAGGTGLHAYVASVLQQVLTAATEHEALSVCIVQAAASCAMFCDEAAVVSLVHQQVQQLLQACWQPAATAGPGAAAPPAGIALAVKSWETLAVQPCRWGLLLPSILQCVPVDKVLTVLQDNLSAAAGSATGIIQSCDTLAALQTSHPGLVVQWASQTLCAALSTGRTQSLLPPLLMAAHLMQRGDGCKEQLMAMLQPVTAACQQYQAAVTVPPLLRAFNLLLAAADTSMLEVQVEVLRQLRPSLGHTLEGEAAKTESMLRDALAEQQQLASSLKGQGQHSAPAARRAAYDSYSILLAQYMARPADAAGRRPLPQQNTLKLFGAQKFCDAFTEQPPDTLERARACFSYMQELEALKWCKAGQAEDFQASCLAFGLDLSDPFGTAQAASEPQHPIDALQALLNRLPAAIRAGSRPASKALLAGTLQHMQRILQHHAAEQQPQPRQQHEQRATEQPPAKRPRMGAPGAGAARDSSEVLGMFLAAYGMASSGGPAAGWQLDVLGMLHELPCLHLHLVGRLLGSLQGSAWPAQEAPQQALWHGSLLAWLSVSKPQQLLVLAPGHDETLVSSATIAQPCFTWLMGTDASSSTATQSCAAAEAGAPGATYQKTAGQHGSVQHGDGGLSHGHVLKLRGLQLVQHLIGHTSLSTAQQHCCAASFWAGYVGCVKTYMGQWCAGAQGPFGSPATAGSTPGTSAADTQQPSAAAAPGAESAGQQQLLAYTPIELAMLLRQVSAALTADAQEAAAGRGDVSYGVVASALQVVNRALRAQALKWVCGLYGL